jgi:cellobiose dehydrogenase (acceptor)
MVNALMFVPPQPADFDDAWPAGWKWDDMSAAADRAYTRNPGTRLPSSDGQRYDQAVYDVFSSFLANNSWTEVDPLGDPGAKTNAYSHPPWNIKGAQRAGPVMTYLPLAQARDNFEMMLETKVVRVVREGSVATGVEIETGSTRKIIPLNVQGKVVVAAGSLSTPRVLFNSGIGPTEQIRVVQTGSAGVALPDEVDWINLPVGQHLMDHPIFTLALKTTKTNFTYYDFTAVSTSSANASDTALYNGAGSGILAQSGQRLNFWTGVNGTNGKMKYVQGTVAPKAANTITLKVYLTHGLSSTGSLGITADGTTTFIKEPWMNTEDDKAAASAFLDTFLGYLNTQDDLQLSTTLTNVTGVSLIETYATGAHYVGTAKMGAENDGSAVVDTDTKVFGMDNLVSGYQ